MQINFPLVFLLCWTNIISLSIFSHVPSPGKETPSVGELTGSTSQSLQNEADKNRQTDQVYSVPIDVLQTISKDFNNLEAEFEKSSGEYKSSIENREKQNQNWVDVKENKKSVGEGKKTLRIKSIRTIKTNSSTSGSMIPELEEAPPPGTVARVEIKTDRARNKTIFTILPAVGGWLKGSSVGEPHSFSVNTCNLSKATQLIKPLHLEKLPILRDILETSIKASMDLPVNQNSETKSYEKVTTLDQSSSSLKIPCPTSDQETNFERKASFKSSNALSRLGDTSRVHHDLETHIKKHENSISSKQLPENNGYKHSKKMEENDFLRELETYGLHYDKICRIENSLDSNKGAKGPKSSWLCPETGCHKNFPKLSKLKIHIFSHNDVRPFKCQKPGCSWAFHTAFKLKRHENTAHAHKDQKLKYECKLDKCVEKVKSFSSPYNLNQHLKRHARPLDFKCPAPGCEAAFQTKMELKSHLKSSIHRSLILQNLEAGSLESEERLIMLPEHICHGCGKRFFNSKDLIIHVNQFHSENDQSASNSKTNKPTYRCTFERCEKVFELPSRLAAHARTHTGERPYPCRWPSCCWSFRTASKLRRHERTHKNDRKYVCSICSKGYFRPEHLKSHMLAIHNPSGSPERFVCPLNKCGKKFSARSTLYVHMKKHAGEQRLGDICSSLFRCVIESCDKKFYDRNELRKHVSLYHVQELAESTAGMFPSDETEEKEQLTFTSQPSVVTTDQETVTATAELDFIALLSSVGDEDGVTSNITQIENIKIDNAKSSHEQLSISENSSNQHMISNTEGEVFLQRTSPSHEKCLESSATETVISQDQMISEMIIETLTSTSQQREKVDEHPMEIKETTCSSYDEKIQIETLSKFLSKDNKLEKNASDVSSVFISPFSNNAKQTGQQSELITVDASAITPIKVITQHDPQKPDFGHESNTNTLPISSLAKEDIITDPFSQIPTEDNGVQRRNSQSSKLNLDLSASDHPPAFKSDTIPSLLTLKSKNKNNSPKQKRQPKRVSVLRSKQPNGLCQKVISLQMKTNFDKITTPVALPIKIDNLSTFTSERKRPSILRRSKSALSPPFVSNPKIGNQYEKEQYKDSPHTQQFAETVICKKRAPKKQKLPNLLQEH